jgi:hypothetical protein
MGTGTAAAQTESSGQPAKMGELARLTGVLWEPGGAFRDIAAHPRWWPPMAIIVVLSLVFVYSFSQRVGYERFYRQQAETNSRMQSMDPAAREQTINVQVKVAPYFFYGFSVIGTPVTALIVAAIFLLIFKTFLGADVTFRQVYAVCCYAMIPLIFSSIMALAVMLLKDPDQFDLQNATPTNIGAFLDAVSTPKWLYSLASSVDAFTLWVLALLATGLSVAARRISWATSMTWVAGSWGIWVLIKMGLAAAFS